MDTTKLELGETEWEMAWNEIYEEQGIVQNQVLEPVKAFVDKQQLLCSVYYYRS